MAIDAITVDKLAMALRGQQEVDTTLTMCARTFQRWQAMHGPGYPNTQRACYSYARALLAAGRAGEATKYAEAALAGIRKNLGKSHTSTGDALQLIVDARHATHAIEMRPVNAPAA